MVIFKSILQNKNPFNTAGTKALVGANVLDSLSATAIWAATGQPDVLLGIIPIYAVQRYEVARSLDKMKYRAVAGQFFAHQRGGNVAFKVVLYLVGSDALQYLTFIQAAHALGDQGMEEIKQLTNTNPGQGLASLVSNTRMTSKNTKTFNKDDLSWQTVEKKFTFPIVTKEEILHDMYIETVIYERDVALGDALKVTLLCRKYVPPQEIVGIELYDKEGKVLLGGKGTSQILKGGVIETDVRQVKVEYATNNNSNSINAWGLLEQGMYRAFVSNIADRNNELQLSRTWYNRESGNLYLQSAKFFKKLVNNTYNVTIGAVVDSLTNKSDEIEVSPTSANSSIDHLVFDNNVEEGIKLVNPSDAEHVQFIKNNESADINIQTPTGNYLASLNNENGSLSYSPLTKTYKYSTAYDTVTNTYIRNGGLYLLMEKVDGGFNIYSYTGNVIKSMSNELNLILDL